MKTKLPVICFILFLSDSDDRAVKSTEQLERIFSDMVCRRNTWIQKKAESCGVAQPTRGTYTQEEWKHWLQNQDLKDYMDEIIADWKREFEWNGLGKWREVEKLREQDTRESKKEANNIVNGAWKAQLFHLYGRSGKQLAMGFFKLPSTMVDTMLQQWEEYMKSPKYLKERHRARKNRPQDEKKGSRCESASVQVEASTSPLHKSSQKTGRGFDATGALL